MAFLVLPGPQGEIADIASVSVPPSLAPMTAPAKPYTVELHVSRSLDDSVRAGRFDVELRDRERTGTWARTRPGVGVAFLDLRDQIIPGVDLPVAHFLDDFLAGAAGTHEDGLRFGQHLLAQLLGDLEMRVLWDDIQARLNAEKRPLRLELVLPARDAEVVAEIPFELLADESGFLFRRAGATLVRAIQRLRVRAAEINEGDAIMVAWANPAGPNRLPAALFERHEASVLGAAAEARLLLKAPCQHATLAGLEERLMEGSGTPVVSLIAHGDPGGGATWLHRAKDPAYPDDPGLPVEARDLANVFRRGKVKLALLWTCHGGRHNEVSGALATTLLAEEHGDVAAVVAAHAALRAESTADVVERLFASLVAPAGGDVERAVAEARLALAETDLQWAAPVYYARPDQGRSVTLAEALEAAADTLREVEGGGVGELERAPAPWPHFRGREDEVARGLAFLRTARLVSVTGLPGMGKTEAALEMARQAAPGHARALWLALDAVRDTGALRAMLAAAFGADPKDCPDDAALARRIGETRALLVLDNAEDVIRGDRGRMRALADTLLRECRWLSLLLATREALGSVRAAEERVVHIGKLREVDARAVFVSLAGERLSPEDLGGKDLGRLLAWLDGHPLSLVLVARQVGTMKLDALLLRLETRGAEAVHAAELFGEEATGEPGERFTRLESSLGLSYGPLAEKQPGAAEMFAWLGHFPAGLPEALVGAVFGEEEVERRAVLLRRGLADEVRGERRLVMPAPVRAYAQARARELGPDRTRKLVVRSFGALAPWLAGLLNQVETPGAREALAIASHEADNFAALLAVVEDASFKIDSVEYARDLANKIAFVASLFGMTVNYNGQAERLLSMLQRAEDVIRHVTGPGEALAKVLTACGQVAFFAAKIEAAERSFLSALALYVEAENLPGRASVLAELGELRVRQGRPNEAEEAFRESIRVHDANAAKLEAANARGALARLYLMVDRNTDAERLFREIMATYQELGSQLGEANTHKVMGDLYARSGHPQDAEAAYLQALPLYRKIGHRLQEANLLRSLGELCFHTSRLDKAQEAYERALALFEAIEEPIGIANTQLLLGIVYEHRGHVAEAEKAIRAAIATQHKSGDALGLSNSYKILGSLFAHLDRHADAEAAFDEAVLHARAVGDRLNLANGLTQRAGVYADTDRTDQAAAAYEEALSTHRSIGNALGEANCLSGQSNLALRNGNLARSYELAAQAMPIYKRLGEVWGVASALADMAKAVFLGGDPLHAAALMNEVFRLRENSENARDMALALMLLAHCLDDLGLQGASYAAVLLAFSRAAAISPNHPLAVEIARNVRRKPPSAAEAFQYHIEVKAALATCAERFAERGADLHAAPSLGLPQRGR